MHSEGGPEPPRTGENFRAFDYLGNSLTDDPKNPKTILAAGLIIQDHSDMDVALVKCARDSAGGFWGECIRRRRVECSMFFPAVL